MYHNSDPYSHYGPGTGGVLTQSDRFSGNGRKRAPVLRVQGSLPPLQKRQVAMRRESGAALKQLTLSRLSHFSACSSIPTIALSNGALMPVTSVTEYDY